VKLHDLHPAAGSRRERTRVGRGIAAGKGKTAGRGTKGQRSRTGSSKPAWFEGGQTPIHMRVPKLRGFKNRFRVEYAVVNVGRIESALTNGRLEPGPRGAPATVNAELLFAAGLVGRLDRPLKVLGGGELDHPVLAIADAFSAEARRKIEAAGGTAMTLEVPEAEPAKPRRPSPGVPVTSAPEVAAPAPEVESAPEPPSPGATEAALAAEATPPKAEPAESIQALADETAEMTDGPIPASDDEPAAKPRRTTRPRKPAEAAGQEAAAPLASPEGDAPKPRSAARGARTQRSSAASSERAG